MRKIFMIAILLQGCTTVQHSDYCGVTCIAELDKGRQAEQDQIDWYELGAVGYPEFLLLGANVGRLGPLTHCGRYGYRSPGVLLRYRR
jgi:hypothetical protein